MPLPFAIPAAVKAVPWGLVLKAGVLAAVFAFGVGVGCSQQKQHDAAAYRRMVDRKDAALGKAATQLDADARQLRAVAGTFADITASTKAAAAKGAEQIERARKEAAAAAQEAKVARQRAAKAQSDLDRAKRDPKCKADLEADSCAAFD